MQAATGTQNEANNSAMDNCHSNRSLFSSHDKIQSVRCYGCRCLSLPFRSVPLSLYHFVSSCLSTNFSPLLGKFTFLFVIFCVCEHYSQLPPHSFSFNRNENFCQTKLLVSTRSFNAIQLIWASNEDK